MWLLAVHQTASVAYNSNAAVTSVNIPSSPDDFDNHRKLVDANAVRYAINSLSVLSLLQGSVAELKE